MKYINLVICILMLIFIGVQYNDPDGPLWMAIYAVPAFWAALAFFNQRLFQVLVAKKLMLVSLIAALAGMVYFWPTSSHWWAKDVWWETETAREGMGMMIVTIALLTSWAVGRVR
ncbi:transmembrane 220 family protein [Granulosicoccus sp. 3-233]|uniref:transmembrane 220 family protein n=1 Tax=Granulosicoccus sp. 3-233 TaxID=3417969 RepID=UPI003D34B247